MSKMCQYNEKFKKVVHVYEHGALVCNCGEKEGKLEVKSFRLYHKANAIDGKERKNKKGER